MEMERAFIIIQDQQTTKEEIWMVHFYEEKKVQFYLSLKKYQLKPQNNFLWIFNNNLRKVQWDENSHALQKRTDKTYLVILFDLAISI